ncbi:uncharacterized protein LOC125660285 [Ostrea edulis]|uniref:uncharacterized protein LOC125660285 n=1 Tax=Ostrea edulis TaxID=37623 RepID=UPI0024AFC342|nr:uncharacterized protein LOC125660285 [Ostrea edulis]
MTNTLDGYKWQGCEPYNFSTFVHFKDSGSIPFESNRQCYKTKKDLDFALEQKECTENNGAICEQHIEGNTCPLSTLISLELKDVQSKTKADCINTCESDVTCYAIVSYSNAECLLMKANEASEGSSSEVKIAIRQCIRGEVKDSTEVITPTEVTDKIPHLNCGTGAGECTFSDIGH